MPHYTAGGANRPPPLFFYTPRADPPGSNGFSLAMERLTDARLVGGNRVRILQNGTLTFAAMLRAIDHAKKRISCETYILRPDDVGNRIIAALTRAARRKVTVRLMYDGIGSRALTTGDIAELVKAGAEVRVFNPFKSWTAIRVNNRNHRKTLTIDGQIGFIGGINMGAEYDGDGLSGWRDTHLEITGAGALAIEQVFANTWKQAGTSIFNKDLPIVGANIIKRPLEKPFLTLIGRAPTFTPPLPPRYVSVKRGVTVRIVSSAPDQMASRLLDMYLLAVNSATHRVYITSGYFVPPKTLERALIAAAKRGVDVQLILQGKTDEPTVRKISIGYYGRLLKAGARIHEWNQSVLHAKTIVVDGKWLSVGSANLDGRALFLNYEANACLVDTALATKMEQQFRADVTHSKAIHFNDWSQRSLKQKATEILLAPVEGQF